MLAELWVFVVLFLGHDGYGTRAYSYATREACEEPQRAAQKQAEIFNAQQSVVVHYVTPCLRVLPPASAEPTSI